MWYWQFNCKTGNLNQAADYAMSHPWHGTLFQHFVLCSQIYCKRLARLQFMLCHGIGQVHCPDFKTVPYLTFYHIRPVKLWGLFQNCKDVEGHGFAPAYDNCCVEKLSLSVCFFEKLSLSDCFCINNAREQLGCGATVAHGYVKSSSAFCQLLSKPRRMNEGDSVPYYKDYTVSIFTRYHFINLY